MQSAIKIPSQDAGASSAQPLVSVIIPTYNYGHYIGELLDSCFAQSYQKFEVIIVDDGSTDDTASIVASYAERYPGRISYHVQQNAGVGVARNAGLARSSGEFIVFTDADDYLTSDAIETRLRGFTEHPEAGIVISQKYNLRHGRIDYKPRFTRSFVTDDLYVRVLQGSFSAAINTSMLRAQVAKRHTFAVEIRGGEEDIPYMVKLLFENRAFVMARPTLVMRYHESSLRNAPVERLYARATLIKEIFDDPAYGGKLEPYRAIFTTNVCLFIFKGLYKSGDYAAAREYYRRVIAVNPLRNLFRLKPLLRYLRLSSILAWRGWVGKPEGA